MTMATTTSMMVWIASASSFVVAVPGTGILRPAGFDRLERSVRAWKCLVLFCLFLGVGVGSCVLSFFLFLSFLPSCSVLFCCRSVTLLTVTPVRRVGDCAVCVVCLRARPTHGMVLPR